ncbi:BEM_collapsed_G0002190.mRNA.1.CDS.1 [Saccharomyces cerevisiae]|nr:BEM_collapsed_G0002190.mRNA.1.CDS.1 [Saccharomyces cerevisiae]
MDSQFSYAHSNKSSISFESIQTTERLLDKLDLSLEDELILQEALLEEENASRNSQLSQTSGPTLCMPASEFPSLRYRTNPSPTYIQARDRSLIIDNLKEKDSTLRGKYSSGKVERHLPVKSRYSYIVEEDYDSETFSCMKPQMNRNEKDYKYPNLENGNRSTNSPNPFNFEKYRIENTRLHHLYPTLISDNNISVDNNANSKNNRTTSNNINTSTKTDRISEKQSCPNEFTTTQKSNCLYRNGSSTSTNTSFSEVGQLSKPKTQSSFESESSSFSKLKLTKSDTTPIKPSPKRSNSSTSTITKTNTMTNDISLPPTPPYKAHKKKTSLNSLKKLFKSPRTRAKNKKDLESEGSSPIRSATNSLDFSGRIFNFHLLQVPLIIPVHI